MPGARGSGHLCDRGVYASSESARSFESMLDRRCSALIAKFHYTDPTGPDTDPTELRRKKVLAGSCGSGRVRVGSV